MGEGRGFSIDLSHFNVMWFFRKKHFNASNVEASQLKRCLGLLELTALGIGATLGAGIYVVTPDSTRQYGGPAMCISFVIAAVASVLSGLCYAELGARIPRAGSAYVYSYVAVGELWAFIVGWNMILEYVIGTASVARAAVTYIDVLAHNVIQTTFKAYFPIHVSFLGQYFDPIAFGITMLLTVLLAFGVKESTFVNNLLVIVNVSILVYITVIGFVYADPSNWSLTLEQVQEATHTNDTSFGTGGFMPYGFGGVMTAASAAFYSFVGFDCIATTGEEVSNPRRNIPLSIVLSLTVCAVAYFCVSVVFTLDTPYYNLSSSTLLPSVPYGSIVVSIGAILCASTSLLGGMFPLPRVIYAMAEDGLLFNFLASINQRFQTPFIATILSGFLTAAFASLFDVNQLVDMLSIGTLMAYSLVAASVLVLRYRESFLDTSDDDSLSESCGDEVDTMSGTHQSGTNDLLCTSDDLPLTVAVQQGSKHSVSNYIKSLVTLKNDSKRPSSFTSMIAIILSVIVSVTILAAVTFAMVFVVYANGQWWPAIFIAIFGLVTVGFTARLWFLPQNRNFKTFQVPGVPIIPVLALGVNFYLLVSLNYMTWVRFGVWMAIGFVIYFFYSIWASKERQYVCADDAAVASGSGENDENGIEATVGGSTIKTNYQSASSTKEMTSTTRQATSSFSSQGSQNKGSRSNSATAVGKRPLDETTPVLNYAS